MADYVTRIELYCGSSQNKSCSIAKRKNMYDRAKEVADRYNTDTYFDEIEEHGVTYVDGYVYPCSKDLLKILDELDKAKVEYDNIDIPDKLDGSALHKKLLKKFGLHRGVEINPGEIETEKCRLKKD